MHMGQYRALQIRSVRRCTAPDGTRNERGVDDEGRAIPKVQVAKVRIAAASGFSCAPTRVSRRQHTYTRLEELCSTPAGKRRSPLAAVLPRFEQAENPVDVGVFLVK